MTTKTKGKQKRKRNRVPRQVRSSVQKIFKAMCDRFDAREPITDEFLRTVHDGARLEHGRDDLLLIALAEGGIRYSMVMALDTGTILFGPRRREATMIACHTNKAVPI